MTDQAATLRVIQGDRSGKSGTQVPRRAIAFVARACYGEPYTALPMRHRIDQTMEKIRVEYGWQRKGRWESVHAVAEGQPETIQNGSVEEFVTEHYWGYTARKVECSEYQVEHPRWRVWRAAEATLDAEVSSLYGDAFVERLSALPASAFIADGSPVVVRHASNFSEREPNQAGSGNGAISPLSQAGPFPRLADVPGRRVLR